MTTVPEIDRVFRRVSPWLLRPAPSAEDGECNIVVVVVRVALLKLRLTATEWAWEEIAHGFPASAWLGVEARYDSPSSVMEYLKLFSACLSIFTKPVPSILRRAAAE
jgi:hypothetical protein